MLGEPRTITRVHVSAPDRFWSKVARGAPDDCWPWIGARERAGYGILAREERGLVHKTHRLSWQMANGPIPDGLFVCHRCDNPPCVNPAHLYVGTASDNATDRASRGRGRENRVRGEASPVAKLSDAQVIEIRRLVASGMTQQAVADRFGIVQPHVSRIVRGVSRVTPM